MVRIFRGRQKTPKEKIDKESNRQVTFSKRRMGLFKKANELAIICGAEVAFIVFSPGKNVYSFAHPSLDVVVNRYLDYDGNVTNNQPNASISPMLEEITEGIAEMKGLCDESKKKGKEVDNRDSNNSFAWDVTKTDGLNLQLVEILASKMEKFCNDMFIAKAKQISLQTMIIDWGNGDN